MVRKLPRHSRELKYKCIEVTPRNQSKRIDVESFQYFSILFQVELLWHGEKKIFKITSEFSFKKYKCSFLLNTISK